MPAAELLPLARRVQDDHEQCCGWATLSSAISAHRCCGSGVVAAGAGALTTAAIASTVQAMPHARIEMRRLGFFDVARRARERAGGCRLRAGADRGRRRIRSSRSGSEPRVLVVPVDAPAGRPRVGRRSARRTTRCSSSRRRRRARASSTGGWSTRGPTARVRSAGRRPTAWRASSNSWRPARA